jgi:DNA repair protein RadD
MLRPTLYPHQIELRRKIDAAIGAGQRSILAVAPTGSGKTICFADLVAAYAASGRSVLVLVHRRELVEQTATKLLAFGIDAGIIMAGIPPRPGPRVQIAMVPTLHARAIRVRTLELPDADLVVVDECHHAPAQTWQTILRKYPRATILGVSATPCRSDSRGLGSVFDCLVAGPTVAELIDVKLLVPTRCFAPTIPDLKGVRVRRGDFDQSQLAERVDTPKIVGDIVQHWLKHADRRSTIIFAINVAHAVHIRDEMRRADIVAEVVSAETPTDERNAILKRLERGEVDVVVNCAVLTEGFDCPRVGVIVLARPTQSLGLYLQMLGRGLRPYPGKDHLLVLDHSGNVLKHGFPEDEIVWTLNEGEKAENRVHAARGKSPGLPRLTQCPECQAVAWEGRGCTVCGWRPRPKAKAYDVLAGELGEVGRDRKAASPYEDRRHFYQMIEWIRQERGRKPGWVANTYRDKFKAYPPDHFKGLAPVPADDATRAWVRHRDIAFAKSRAA